MNYGEIAIKKCLRNLRLNKRDKFKVFIMMIVFMSSNKILIFISKKMCNQMKSVLMNNNLFKSLFKFKIPKKIILQKKKS